jgi:hypothetical protein
LVHISKTAKHSFHISVFFNVFTKWTMAKLHIRKFIFVLDEELAAILAHLDRHLWDEVFKVAFGILRVQVAVVLDVDFFKPHIAQDVLIYFDRLVL